MEDCVAKCIADGDCVAIETQSKGGARQHCELWKQMPQATSGNAEFTCMVVKKEARTPEPEPEPEPLDAKKGKRRKQKKEVGLNEKKTSEVADKKQSTFKEQTKKPSARKKGKANAKKGK